MAGFKPVCVAMSSPRMWLKVCVATRSATACSTAHRHSTALLQCLVCLVSGTPRCVTVALYAYMGASVQTASRCAKTSTYCGERAEDGIGCFSTDEPQPQACCRPHQRPQDRCSPGWGRVNSSLQVPCRLDTCAVEVWVAPAKRSHHRLGAVGWALHLKPWTKSRE